MYKYIFNYIEFLSFVVYYFYRPIYTSQTNGNNRQANLSLSGFVTPNLPLVNDVFT